jgi:hypothetical protein
MKEEWKQVRQHKHTLGADYWVSSYGRVKSVIRGKTRIIKPWMMGNYFGVTLGGVKSKTGKKRPDTQHVHTLVLRTFKGVQEGCVVHHIDNNKLNNRLDNLEWATFKHNSQESKIVGQLLAENARLRAEVDRLTVMLSQ